MFDERVQRVGCCLFWLMLLATIAARIAGVI